MKKLLRISLILAICLVATLALAVGAGATESTDVTINVEPKTATLGEMYTLQLVVTMSEDIDISFTSDHPNIARVDENGLVRAINPGTTRINVIRRGGGYLTETRITVVESDESLVIEPAEITVTPGKTVQYTVRTRSGKPVSVVYRDSGSNGATITQSGLATATGQAISSTIEAKDEYGRYVYAEMMIEPTKVSLDPSTHRVGDSGNLYAYTDVYGYYDYYYVSSDPSIMDFTRPDTGEYICLSSGTVTIGVMTENGLVTTAQATVNPIAGLYAKDEVAFVSVGESLTLSVLDEKTKKSVKCKFTSDDPSVAKVDKSSGKVTGVKPGLAIVYAEAGQRYMWFYVYVTAKPTALYFDEPTVYVNVGGKQELYWYSMPEDSLAANATFSSSNKKVATVSSDGVVTGVGKGTATITAKLFNGVKTTCQVTVGIQPEYVRIFAGQLTMGVGQRYQAPAPTFNTGAASTFTYSSNAPGVVSVSGYVLEAKGTGTATITVTTANGKTDTCKVTVLPAPTDIKTSANDVRLGVAESQALSISLSDGSGGAMEITVANPKIAKYSGGAVVGVTAGTTTLTVKTYNGLEKKISITVLAAPTKVALSPGSASLPIGKTQSLSIKFTGNPTTLYTFKSSNTKVATVDAAGLVTAKSTGKATITVTTHNKKSAKCTITVVRPVTEVKVTGQAQLISGKKVALKAAITPSNASNKKLSWLSSNSAAATVDSKGRVKAGKVNARTDVVITARAIDGSGVFFEYPMVILPAAQSVQILYENSAISALPVNLALTNEVRLSARVNPADASQSVSWKSSNKKIATVGSDGVVRVLKAGKVKITATGPDKKSATLTITAFQPVAGINITGAAQLIAGKSITLKAVVSPSSATTKKLTWFSSNNAAATVDSRGKVKAGKVKARTDVVITAKATDGSGVYYEYPLVIVPLPASARIAHNGQVIDSLTADRGQTPVIQLTAPIEPADASQAVTWKSSNSKVAKIGPDGKLTLLKDGTVTITATSSTSSKVKASIKLTIKQLPLPTASPATMMSAALPEMTVSEAPETETPAPTQQPGQTAELTPDAAPTSTPEVAPMAGVTPTREMSPAGESDTGAGESATAEPAPASTPDLANEETQIGGTQVDGSASGDLAGEPAQDPQ